MISVYLMMRRKITDVADPCWRDAKIILKRCEETQVYFWRDVKNSRKFPLASWEMIVVMSNWWWAGELLSSPLPLCGSECALMVTACNCCLLLKLMNDDAAFLPSWRKCCLKMMTKMTPVTINHVGGANVTRVSVTRVDRVIHLSQSYTVCSRGLRNNAVSLALPTITLDWWNDDTYLSS